MLRATSSLRTLSVVLGLAFCVSGAAHADDYTSIVVTAPHLQTQIFPATDGKRHVVYELLLANALRKPVPLQKVEVIDATNPARILAVYEGPALLAHLRNIANGPSQSAELEVNGARILFVDIAFVPGDTPPSHLLHRLTVLAAIPGDTSDAPAPQTYTAAPVEIIDHVLTIGPPLRGNGWVAFNGCCEPGGTHRSTGLPVNGSVHFAQRFAIDWMKLDSQGHLVNGDLSDVHSYVAYDADVIAVADGTIVSTLNTLDDQKPPNNPDPKTITLTNISGNHIIEDLGNGVFAFYAHMQKGSINVTVGGHVKRGQVIGHLGNTGNTSAPHLHFHLMDSPSMLGSSGLPYVIDSFAVAGKISVEKFNAAPTLAGDWNAGLLASPTPRHDEFPMDFTIVNFGSN